jgi:hypothetical protein
MDFKQFRPNHQLKFRKSTFINFQGPLLWLLFDTQSIQFKKLSKNQHYFLLTVKTQKLHFRSTCLSVLRNVNK